MSNVVIAHTFTNNIDNQSPANYKYDKTGNLIEDVSESTRIHWTYYNKVKQIDSVKLTPPKYGLVWATKLRMKYDALGNRVVKENPKHKVKEVYVRDAQGNILALYQVKNDSLYTKEFYIYGSQRLGYLEDNVLLGRKCIGKFCNVLTPVLPMLPSTLSNSVGVVFGKKRYEISDWLGNVRVVINDRKTPVNIGATTVGYKAQVVGVSDYYSFGSEIAERSYDPVKPNYRFGFNKHERLDEVYGKGNVWNFGDYGYDARLGRRWNVEPNIRKYPWMSSYAVFGNNPLKYADWDGRDIHPYLITGQDESGKMIYTYGKLSAKLENVIRDILKTPEGYAFLSQFARAGQTIAGYTFKETGKLADHDFFIYDYNYNTPTTILGQFGVNYNNKKDNLSFKIKIFDTYREEFSIAETWVHETMLHGKRMVKEAIRAFDKGGKKEFEMWIKKEGETNPYGKKDHEAFDKKDLNSETYKNYVKQKEELLKVKPEYKKGFDENGKK